MHGMAWYRHSRDFRGFMGPQTGVLGATRRNLTSERAVQVHSLIRKMEREGTAQLPAAEGIAERGGGGVRQQDGDADRTDSWSPLIWTSPIISNLENVATKIQLM
ncbi:hypothetical protein LX36DRAFT_683634 [Colletotrichum falcatum]|nr:hypothetical protein LX36DRAFT_683634 [Colletotrichum falcatum]